MVGESFRTTVGIQNLSHRGRVYLLADTLVDSGNVFTWMPRGAMESLNIKPERRQTFTVGGRQIERDLGYAIVHAGGAATAECVVFAESNDVIVLGARSLDGLNLKVDLAGKRLVDAGPIPAAANHAVLIDNLSAAAATASLSAGAAARSHDWIPHSRSSSDARSSRFMLVNR
jgi:predicted aspartyl protease